MIKCISQETLKEFLIPYLQKNYHTLGSRGRSLGPAHPAASTSRKPFSLEHPSGRRTLHPAGSVSHPYIRGFTSCPPVNRYPSISPRIRSNPSVSRSSGNISGTAPAWLSLSKYPRNHPETILHIIVERHDTDHRLSHKQTLP